MANSLLSFLLWLPITLLFPGLAASQECSATQLCAVGCCSQFGFCGTDSAHCGAGCLSTCDYKLGCDANNPCADGSCCSKFGFCGLGQDYCSPDKCVAGCGAKADCDPGSFGVDYVEYETCPLNVCCSKWGYCGTTTEFCGNKTVDRPSCDNSNSVTRVLGYYEGWASRRSCQAFFPENVPAGVYTHLNFAFASVDPNTFKVVPADAGDVDLYSRLTALKKQDSALKVFIAIGGWDFNNPGGATANGNKWLGPFLNSHTNLTEITQYLDLLWRNTINPNKVNMGLAFYSRTFIASSTACMEPACTFDAVGDPGPCTNSLGTLSNAELTDKIKAAGVTPSLDKDAAVEMASVGNWWITYDDEASWQLKLDFARGECLGGVMVWAVSQDYTDGTYSKQLQSVTGYTSPAVLFQDSPSGDGSTVTGPDPYVVRNQCLWTNCGQTCPSGYSTVPRKDTDARSGEIMLDGSRCRGGPVRTFCCPSASTIPNCGWFDFWNGKCGKGYSGVCPAGSEDIIGPFSSEVATTSIACNRGFQVACCETDPNGFDIPSDIGYATCQWDGTPPDCSDARGPPDQGRDVICSLYDDPFTYLLEESPAGSGAVSCSNNGIAGLRGYCCLPPGASANAQWQNCQWQGPRVTDDGFCEAYCPDGTVRIAMQDPYAYDPCTGGAGGRALCCTPHFLSQATSDAERQAAFVSALDDVATSTCSWPSTSSELSEKRTAAPEPQNGEKKKRQSPGTHDYNCAFAFANTYNMLGTLDADLRASLDSAWNQAIVQDRGFRNLPASRLHTEPTGVAFSAMQSPLATMFAENVLNVIPDLATHDESDEAVPVCPLLWDADLNLFEDEDSGGIDEGYAYTRRKVKRSLDALEEAEQSGHFRSRWATEQEDEAHANATARLRALGERLRGRAGNEKRDQVDDHDDHDDGWEQSVDELLDRLELDDDDALYLNTTLPPLLYGPHPKDGVDVGELVRRLLEERQSLGGTRTFRIRSITHNNWMIKRVTSSQYPNGNQGDDLRSANGDTSRYKMVARGCGPQDYTLNAAAAKADSQMWVSEHILELQTIMRFLEAILDGQLYPVPSMGMRGIYMNPVDPDVVANFTDGLPAWSYTHALRPGDTALQALGSVAVTQGMVVADSSLNSIKSFIYRFNRPVSNVRWVACCNSPNLASAQRAFSYIQTTMAIFDYYADGNVENRHVQAYGQVKDLLGQFEVAYNVQWGINIQGTMTRAWKYYMGAHMGRVVEFAQLWTNGRLNILYQTWYDEAFRAAAANDALQFMLAVQVCNLAYSHLNAINTGTRITFDTDIFY
ncbi:hypothetical protein QBC46DRAFT_319536 [Diplogelasinospora grovesii]|uniref:chitinase n=1 Tax=Diplogelasinospora grovesii TaxID=303347 RepID=A0AAN6N467_9PEZI|nr:hypothetical protein QBC46DRAFT_319536 [Diplogelasinospora grovesii]